MGLHTSFVSSMWPFSSLLMTWVHVHVNSSENLAAEIELDPHKPTVYVLPKRSVTDLLVLYYLCKKYRLPLPTTSIGDLKQSGQASYVYLARPGIIQTKQTPHTISSFVSMIERVRAHDDVQLVPVSVIWGRNPGKGEKSFFKLLFTDDENAGSLHKAFIVMAQGRKCHAHFGKSVQLQDFITSEGLPDDQVARKLRRVFRVHFTRQRTAVLGSRLYVFERVLSDIVQSPAVQRMIDEETKKKDLREKHVAKAYQYAREIASDMQYPVVMFLEVLLTWVWHKIFQGLVVKNIEPINKLATEAEIVYVPTHRSHIDYMVLNFCLFQCQLPVPHTAAGINLNFWPAGPIIRRAGGFFIRRSFAGNRLYAAVFSEYVHYLLTHGYSVSFFPEGGRSRTGQVLPLKTGMLAMVVHSYLRKQAKPLVFVPISINYDKVVEVRSYMKELSGASKRKESFGQLLEARRVLKNKFGQAYLSFGNPIPLAEFLDRNAKSWRQEQLPEDRKPEWFAGVVDQLAHDIAIEMNASTTVSLVALMSLVLLSTPQKALPEDELYGVMEALRQMLQKAPYDKNIHLPDGDLRAQIKDLLKLEVFCQFQHVGGDIIYLDMEQSVLNQYYKSNIVHVFALPAVIARFFQTHDALSRDILVDACQQFYPFLQTELFLKWTPEELPAVLNEILEAMIAQGLLRLNGQRYERAEMDSPQAVYLQIIGRMLGFMFDRSLIALALLAHMKPNTSITREGFELQCQKMTQRSAILSGLRNLETNDKAHFLALLNFMKKLGLIEFEAEGRIVVKEQLRAMSRATDLLLNADIRASIRRMLA